MGIKLPSIQEAWDAYYGREDDADESALVSSLVSFQIAAEGVHRDVLPAVPGYLDVNLPSLKATVTRKPEVEEIPVQVNIQYVVEFYAR